MNKEFIKQVGTNLKQIRKYNKVSAEYVAEQIGLSRKSYYDIEAGSVDLKVSRLKELSECLDVPMSKILGESTEVVSMIYALREQLKQFSNKRNVKR